MRRFRIAVLVLILAILPFSYALASEAPTSIAIDTVAVFRNLAETGDSLYMFHYSMPFTSDNWSTTPASQSTIFRLYDTDGTTVKQTGAPYVNPFFGTNGYGEGVGSFYFGASDNAPAWGAAVTINIAGLPVFYDLVKNQALSPSHYATATTESDNRELLKAYVLLECDKLAASYSDTGIILKSISDSGASLSPYGDLYFRGVIEGLQVLCPDLFFIQTLTPELIAIEEYDMSLQDTYTERLATDDLGDGFTGIGGLIGVSGGWAAAAMTFVSVMVLCIWTTRKGWGTEIGMLAGGVLTLMMAILVGDIVFSVMMIGALVATIFIAWLFLLKKA